MFCRMTILCVATLLGLIASSPAVAATYVSPRGFSLEYPDHWQVASKELLDATAATEEVRNLLAKLGEVDFDKMAVAVFDPYDSRFANSLNVVIAPEGGVEFSKLSPQNVVEMLDVQYTNLGLQPRNMIAQWADFGTKQVLTVTSDTTLPGAEESIRQRQYFITWGDTVYVVTCSSLTSTFAEHAATFAKIARSIKPTTEAQQ